MRLLLYVLWVLSAGSFAYLLDWIRILPNHGAYWSGLAAAAAVAGLTGSLTLKRKGSKSFLVFSALLAGGPAFLLAGLQMARPNGNLTYCKGNLKTWQPPWRSITRRLTPTPGIWPNLSTEIIYP